MGYHNKALPQEIAKFHGDQLTLSARCLAGRVCAHPIESAQAEVFGTIQIVFLPGS